jgi:hypothetical protein
MAVVRALVAVFAEGAAELADHCHHGMAPGLGSHGFGERRQAWLRSPSRLARLPLAAPW